MRIETKFNVGETVFAAEHDRLNRPLVLKLTIKSIQVFFRGTTIGEWAMVGSGSVVSKNVPNHGLVLGNPARLHGFVCACGGKLEKQKVNADGVETKCKKCDDAVLIPLIDYYFMLGLCPCP